MKVKYIFLVDFIRLRFEWFMYSVKQMDYMSGKQDYKDRNRIMKKPSRDCI